MKAKVLIIEDEAIIAKDIAFTLEESGYQVIGMAKNGDLVLDLLQQIQPDVALIDINIKGSLNGIAIAKIIKEKFQFPYIFLTSHTDHETLQEASKTLPYGYIVKPFTGKDLKSNIEMALVRFQAEKKASEINLEEIQEKLKRIFSEREKEILMALIKGLSYKAIAEKYFISINTVKTYQKRLFSYFKVKSRHELVFICTQGWDG